MLPIPDNDDELYDVMVRLPDGANVDALNPLSLQAAGIPEKYLASLLKLLRAGQMAKVKGAASKARAEQVAERFLRAGLTVSVTPALNVLTLVHDDRVTCPACNERIRVPEDRHCPACGVHVDKITPALLRKRKKIARDRERQTEREAMARLSAEDRMRQAAQADIFRKHIRADLGGAYLLLRTVDVQRSRWRWLGATALVGTLALLGGGVIALGISSHGDWSLARDRLRAGLGGIDATARAPILSAPTPATASGSVITGAPDSTDAVISLRSLALESAVERAAPGPGATRGGTGAAPTIGLTMRSKIVLAVQAVRTLAESGQLRRAETVLAAVRSAPELIGDAPLAADVRLADIELQARQLTQQPASAIATRLPRLHDALDDIRVPAERAIAQARAAAILGEHAHLLGAAAELLAKAQTSATSSGDADARQRAESEWQQANAQLLASEVQRLAASGQLARARERAEALWALATRRDGVHGGAVGEVRLLAAAIRALRITGSDPARLISATGALLAALERAPSAAVRLALLREVAPVLSEAEGRERVAALVASHADAIASAPAAERFSATSDAALALSALGQAARAEEISRRLLASVAPQHAEACEAAASLLVGRELAAVRNLHGSGQYAEAEQATLRLLSYLR